MAALKPKNIDLAKVYNKKPGLSKRSRTVILTVTPMILAAAAAGFVVYRYMSEISSLKADIASQQSYISFATSDKRYLDYDSIRSRMDRLVGINDGLEAAKSAVESYPNIDSVLMVNIHQLASGIAELHSFTYDETTGILTVSGVTASEYGASQYAEKLESEARMSAVTYYGYYGDGDGYQFTMLCFMAGNAGEAQDEAQ